MPNPDPETTFLRRNVSVEWKSGHPTWNYWEFTDTGWQITTYDIAVTLTNPVTRTYEGAAS